MYPVKTNHVRSRRHPTDAVAHRFGAHLSIAGGVHRALEAALALRCDVVQVFVKNQRQWQAAPLKPADLERWQTLLATPGFGPCVAHATYLINLASADRRLFARSRDALAEELRRCDILGIPYLVLHPGSAGDAAADQAITRVARALNEVFERHSTLATTVLLETTAGQGTSLGHALDQLGAIIGQVQEPRRVGVCIDTCHVFAAGYDIRDPDAYRALIAAAEQHVGLERIRCWHLNDSLSDLGARTDRHAHINQGRIGAAGFRNVLADARFRGLPMILETPKGRNPRGVDWDRINLRRLRMLARSIS